MDRFLAGLMDAQARWAKPLGEFNRRWLGALLRPLGPVKDLLHGRWLGHPLHAVVADAPVGILLLVIVLDFAGQPVAADVALVLGILAMLAAALTGAADYVDTDGRALTRATLHSTLMVVALVLYVVSLVVRLAATPAEAGTDRAVPVAISIVGFVVLAAGAYVGGDVVYALGNMVDRHAFRGRSAKWIAVRPGDGVDLDDLPEDAPARATIGTNEAVLVRSGDTVHAIHAVCAHAGGPLAEGAVADGCVTCPWHGSRFRLADGRVVRGPSVYDQPSWEVRRAEGGGWEARRR